MSLATQVSNLATRIGTEIKTVRAVIGSLAGLTTADKTSVVAALNEVRGMVTSAGAQINDAVASNSTVYSATKTDTQIAAATAALVDTAPAALDTLNELAAALGDDPNFATTITTSIGTKAADTAVVHKTGAETVAGVKTFSSAPVVPDASFGITKVSGLQTALDGKAATSHTHTAAQISDATATGRAVLMAADATTARAAIGAGTGTSNVTIGTTAGTAADAAAVGDTATNFVTTFETALT